MLPDVTFELTAFQQPSSAYKEDYVTMFSFCNNVCALCVGVSRSGGYPGGPPMGGMGPGGPYNPPQSANSSRMNFQGPPYSTMPLGESNIIVLIRRTADVRYATYKVEI